MTTVACQHCGVCFDTPEWRLRQGKGKYCGRACANQAMRGFHSQYPVEYMAYHDAKRRCTNPYHEINKKNYKDKGIKFLFESFDQFIAELGPRPDNTSLDRIDNDGDYVGGNVRWATQKQQAVNRSSTQFITHQGETLCYSDWERRMNVKSGYLSNLVTRRGLSPEEALLKAEASASQTSNGGVPLA